MREPVFGPWRKSSFSMNESDCIEVTWRRGVNDGDGADVAITAVLRDSKHPVGGTVWAVPAFFAQVKGGRFDR